MDAQELRNLQEAYMEVYELDEGNKENKQKKNDAVSKIIQKKLHPSVLPSLTYGRRELKKEEVDIYDIILSHLLDEGYAETVEAAEVMMVNMSEEWRDSIIDEMIDEAVLGAKKGTIRSVIGKGGKSIKYVQSGGDIVAGDRAAAARASDAERRRKNKNRANAARAEQARKQSIKNLNAKPGENTQNYGNTDYGHNTPSRYDKDPGGPSGDSHYNLTHSNRAARKRRASGR